MKIDFSAVPRMPDGRTALEHIESVAAKSKALKLPMGPRSAGGNGQMMWHVWGEGSGKPALLLFHGGSGSWIHWIRNVLPLSQHFTVYAYDAPGLGDSDPPDDVRDVWSVTHCVHHAVQALLPKDRQFAITGFSFGGMVSGHLSTLMHDRISPRLYFAFEEARQRVMRDARRLAVPALLLHGAADRITDPKGTLEFCGAAPHEKARYITYRDAYHEIFNDLGREQVIRDMIGWFDLLLVV